MEQLLNAVWRQAQDRGWVKARGKQRTDSTAVLCAVRPLNRLELVGETLRPCLNVLATVVPEWLVQQVDGSWLERYSERVEQSRLAKDKAEQTAWVLRCPMGQDSNRWKSGTDSRAQVILRVSFSRPVCQACPSRYRCTQAEFNPRKLTLLPHDQLSQGLLLFSLVNSPLVSSNPARI